MAILKMLNIKEGKKDPSAGLHRCINYIFNPAKTESCIYTAGSHCPAISAQMTYAQMLRTKELYGKVRSPNGNRRQGYHYILSFSPDDSVTPEMVQEITAKLIDKMLPEFETVYAVHLDKHHLHSHIVFNSVSYIDGHMYHYKQGHFMSNILPEINRLCKQYGLSTIRLEDKSKGNMTHTEWEAKKNGRYTVIGHIQEDIDRLLYEARDYADLLRLLHAEGYQTRLGAENHAHLSIIPPGYEKAFRVDRLGNDYTPDGLRRRITENQVLGRAVPETPENLQEAEEKSPAFFYMEETRHFEAVRKPEVMLHVRYIKIYGRRRPKKLTRFEKLYLRYYLKFSRRRHPTWKESRDVLLAQQMAAEIGYIVKMRPGSAEEVEKRISDLQKTKNRTEKQNENLKILRRIRKKYVWTKKEVKEVVHRRDGGEMGGLNRRKI